MIIESLFPTPIGFFDYKQGITEEELEFCKNVNFIKNKGNKTSENNYILKDEKLLNLKLFFKDCIEKYFLEIYKPNPKLNLKLVITQSWLNASQQNEWHHIHSHHNSIISGVFYLNVNPDDKIFFVRNSPFSNLNFDPVDFNIFNSDSWWFGSKKNQLILFPSTLLHEVTPVVGTETRLSLSFNTFFNGEIGSEFNLTKLILNCSE